MARARCGAEAHLGPTLTRRGGRAAGRAARRQMDKLVKQKTQEREAQLKEEFDAKLRAYKERCVGLLHRGCDWQALC